MPIQWQNATIPLKKQHISLAAKENKLKRTTIKIDNAQKREERRKEKRKESVWQKTHTHKEGWQITFWNNTPQYGISRDKMLSLMLT